MIKHLLNMGYDPDHCGEILEEVRNMKKTLRVVRTTNNLKDAGASSYLKSIERLAKSYDIDIDVVEVLAATDYLKATREEVPTLVLQPCEYECTPIYNIESNQTADVIAEMALSVKDNPLVLIINRSDLIGKPLAERLLKSDASIMMAHSKTPAMTLGRMIDAAEIVVTATGHTMYYGDLSNKVVIDASDDIPNTQRINTKVYYGKSTVGRKTTQRLLSDVSLWYALRYLEED